MKIKKILFVIIALLSWPAYAAAQETNWQTAGRYEEAEREWKKVDIRTRVVMVASLNAKLSSRLYDKVLNNNSLRHKFVDYGVDIEGPIPTENFYLSIALQVSLGKSPELLAEWENSLEEEYLGMNYILENPDVRANRFRAIRVK
ncbi:MAG: hypothetical protein Q8O93_04570 [bacterium]|nr:hypothetical protein [bacterium]